MPVSDQTPRSHRIVSFLFVFLFTGLLAAGLLLRRFVGDLEAQTWDRRLRWLTQFSSPDPRIKIIMIDQSSLDRRANEEGQYWPWPRSLYNPVLYFLRDSGAAGVAFDMLFTERLGTVQDDQKFADAIGHSLPAVTALALRDTKGDFDGEAWAIFKDKQTRMARESRIAHELLGEGARDYHYAALPLLPVLKSSPAVGNVRAGDTSEKISRYASPGAYLNGVPILELPFALYNLLYPRDEGAAQQLKMLLGSDGRFVVRFHGPEGTYPLYSIDAVIQSWSQLQMGEKPQIPLSEFKDSFVFIGSNAPGIFDLRPTPLSGKYSGVEYNATVFDNILHRDFLRKAPLWAAIVGTLALIALAGAGLFFSYLQAQLFLSLSAVAAGLGVSLTAAYFGWWMPLVVPLGGVALASILSFALQYHFEGRQRQFLRNAFGYYVSPEVIDRLVQDPSALALGGERRELTIFFSDLVGFTKLSERLEPPDVAAFLNEFLSEMTDIILEENGTVDKYEGDAIIAFWNAPLEVPNHETHAVRAALRCNSRLKEIAGHFQENYGVPAEIRVGIHTGDVVVGNFGSRTRFNYTMIGDAANLASRLEGANRFFGSWILVSEACRERCGDLFLWRRVGSIKVVGRQEAVVVYEPFLAEDSTIRSPLITAFEEALLLFEGGNFEGARTAFSKLGEDPIAEAYLKRLERIRYGHEELLEWSPVWELAHK